MEMVVAAAGLALELELELELGQGRGIMQHLHPLAVGRYLRLTMR